MRQIVAAGKKSRCYNLPMPDSKDHQASDSRNLKRLFYLRSLVIGGELLALILIHSLTELRPPLLPLLVIIGLQIIVNLWTWTRTRSDRVIYDNELLVQLIIDVLALTGILYFTGGATNPFAWFFLIPLMIAATVLSKPVTWLMAALTTACYSLLMFHFVPLQGQAHMQHNSGFSQHVFGMWFGFALSAALVAWFIAGMASALRDKERSLARAREQALRDEQLVALGTLATGAAHELGTPLATMAVVTGELAREPDLPASLQRRLDILDSQLQRCKQALSVISASAGETQADAGSVVTVENFIQQIIDAWQTQRIDTALGIHVRPGPDDARILGERTLQQAMINLLNNAADASPQDLQLTAHWNEEQLEIEILDRGPGLHPEAADTVGRQQTSHKEHGMGLGLFLTYATLQRLGGRIDLFERNGGGTCTSLQLPLVQKQVSQKVWQQT